MFTKCLKPKQISRLIKFILTRSLVKFSFCPSLLLYHKICIYSEFITMVSSNILYSNCRQAWDSSTCAFANVCGLTATAIFIVVYLPQMYRNFRHRSVRGLSPYWSLSNFTASINNLFFVFNVQLPLFNKIGACYSPLVHGTLLCQFFLFTPHTRNKIIVTCSFLTLWLTIILLQSFLDIYEYMQWLSVVLWSVSSYPQVITYYNII